MRKTRHDVGTLAAAHRDKTGKPLSTKKQEAERIAKEKSDFLSEQKEDI